MLECTETIFSKQQEKLRSDQALVKRLIVWLKKKENSEVKLANMLGYHSSITIGNWIRRGKIPNSRTEFLTVLFDQKN